MKNVLIAIVIFFAPAVAGAVVVLPKDGGKPVMGFLESEDERRVIIRRVLAGGRTRSEVILRSDIDRLIYTVERERLEALDPAEPKAYRDYAEDLQAKQKDPEARETAIRLYLIAAALDPKEYGESSLRGMIKLARSLDEERRFRAMAYLLDEDHDRDVLQAPRPVAGAGVSGDEAQQQLLEAVRLLRQGKGRQSLELLNRPAVRAQVEDFTGTVTHIELTGAASRDLVTPSLLERLLALEVTLTGPTGGGISSGGGSAGSWSQDISRTDAAPYRPLSLATLTEFDPNKSVYRDGKWVEP